jgi:hypothetical protein
MACWSAISMHDRSRLASVHEGLGLVAFVKNHLWKGSDNLPEGHLWRIEAKPIWTKKLFEDAVLEHFWHSSRLLESTDSGRLHEDYPSKLESQSRMDSLFKKPRIDTFSNGNGCP